MIDKVKIGPITYIVEIDSTLVEGNLAGQIIYNEERIRLRPEKLQRQEFLSLLHEIFHALFYAGGRIQDEYLIEFLSYSIYQLFMDNPDLISAIKRLDKKINMR